MTQANRYLALCALVGSNPPNSNYRAAFYLLSFDEELYMAVCDFVSDEGVDFEGIKHAIRGFDERTRFVVDIAHNLFSYDSPCEATPFEISRLGYPLTERVCKAFFIASGEVTIELLTGENGCIELVLCDDQYRRTKQICNFLEGGYRKCRRI